MSTAYLRIRVAATLEADGRRAPDRFAHARGYLLSTTAVDSRGVCTLKLTAQPGEEASAFPRGGLVRITGMWPACYGRRQAGRGPCPGRSLPFAMQARVVLLV